MAHRQPTAHMWGASATVTHAQLAHMGSAAEGRCHLALGCSQLADVHSSLTATPLPLHNKVRRSALQKLNVKVGREKRGRIPKHCLTETKVHC